MEDMHGTEIRNMIRKYRKYQTYAHILEVISVLADLILFYAAGLALNAFYAGIGSIYVSLIAAATALGVCAARWLFAGLREHILAQWQEKMAAEAESLISTDGDADLPEKAEEAVRYYIEDTVSLIAGGMHDTASFVRNGIIVSIAALIFNWKCGIVFAACTVLMGAAVYVFGSKSVRSEERFESQLRGLTAMTAGLRTAAVAVTAILEMKKGTFGLYGVIALLFLCMEYSRQPAALSEKMIAIRRQMFSLARFEELLKGKEPAIIPPVYKEERHPGLKPLLLCAMNLSVQTVQIYGALNAILNVLSLKAYTDFITGIWLLFIAVPLSAFLQYALVLFMYRGTGGKGSFRICGIAASVFAACIVLAHNRIAGILVLACLLVLSTALPLLFQSSGDEYRYETLMKAERVVQAVFLIAVTAGSFLLYWQGKADMASVFLAVFMFMCSSLYRHCALEGVKDDADNK